MDLRSTQLKDTYGNLVTTGTTAGNPTSGGLQNGQGTLLTAVGIGTTSPDAPLTVAGPDGLGTLPSLGTNKTAVFSNANASGDGVQVYLISGNAGSSILYFGDTDDGDVASIQYHHSSNHMAFETNDNERMRIDSSGNVTIKGSNSTTYEALKLQNTHGSSANQGKTKLEFSVLNSISTDVRSTIVSEERTTDSNLSNLIFSISDNNSGNPAEAFRLTGGASAGDTTFLRMASGTGGIQFNGDTASANALDDYEEGSTDATLTATTSGTITANTSLDRIEYTKIGDICHVQGTVYISSVSSPVGYVRINCLPFLSKSIPETADFLSANVIFYNGTTYSQVVATIISNVQYINVFYDASTLVANDRFFIQATYKTA